MSEAEFAQALLAWFDQHGRHDLPWQHPRSAYRVWVSEVMLQQTQVGTVAPYFERFMARFPDVSALAAAPLDDVLQLWSGLGYYARARNLHRAARTVVADHGGRFPEQFDQVSALPGIGRSTAGAILAQACGQRHAILDGNVRRVLARFGGIEGWPGIPRVQAQLWTLAETLLPQARLADYTQALMDLGSLVCTARRPDCARCPLSTRCIAFCEGRTQAIPAARPKRERPQRRTLILLLQRDDGAMLLERRPPAGIWGGLWCPPLAEDTGAAQLQLERLCVQSTRATRLATVQHAFTHFDLDIEPFLHRVQPHAHALHDHESLRWITLYEPAHWPGMPAPIRTLLTRLHAQAPLPLESPHPPCPAPSTASSSAAKPKASTARPTRARSASASSTRSPRKPGKAGSRTRRA